ncbi:M23 family metallopeptidase [Micrococcus terreus]|uniref:M23 family metallopeptidase n=1 Tax=Micrococcus terreus TaxID=574650 RepID=UPI0033D53FA3
MTRTTARRCLALTLMFGMALMGIGSASAGASPAHGPRAGRPAASPMLTGAWIPPAGTGPEDLVLPFDPPPRPWSTGHRGVDLSTLDGQVRAPAPGVVRFVGMVVDRPVLTLAHPGGTLSSFEPIETELAVGDRVVAGDPLGTVDGSVAHCEVPCIHWGVRIPDGWTVGSTLRDRYLDPALLLGWSGPSVLWPLEGDPRSGT